MHRSIRRLLLFLVLLVLLPAVPNRARAGTHHAHHHYLVGVRAFAATRHAAMLYQEAQNPPCDLRLARENALEMEQLANGIEAHLESLVEVMSGEERAAIATHLRRMQSLSRTARRRAAELGIWLDSALHSALGSGPAWPATRPCCVPFPMRWSPRCRSPVLRPSPRFPVPGVSRALSMVSPTTIPTVGPP